MARRSNPRTANGHQRRETVAWLRRQRNPCHICGLGIDYSRPARDPLSFECDELVPVSRGGDPTKRSNVAASHRCCNEWRGNRMEWNRAKAPTRDPLTGARYGLRVAPGVRHSRRW